jgi:hypothetical protein
VRRIEALHILLESPGAPENPAVRDTAHDLVGVAGLLGLTAFSLSLRSFDTARDRAAVAGQLHKAATAAAGALHRQQEMLAAS